MVLMHQYTIKQHRMSLLLYTPIITLCKTQIKAQDDQKNKYEQHEDFLSLDYHSYANHLF